MNSRPGNYDDLYWRDLGEPKLLEGIPKEEGVVQYYDSEIKERGTAVYDEGLNAYVSIFTGHPVTATHWMPLTWGPSNG